MSSQILDILDFSALKGVHCWFQRRASSQLQWALDEGPELLQVAS